MTDLQKKTAGIAITSGLQGGETVVSSGGLFLQFAGSIQ